jgi:hypothetical protein
MFFKALPLFFLFTISQVQRPLVDFDLVIETLKPYGQWESIGQERYAYRPVSGSATWRPLRQGRWLYTDYGWTWEGTDPGSWVTDHYGVWTKKQMAGWVWIPDGQWLPAPVEWLKSGSYIGWRPSRLDRFSNLLESEVERHGDPTEWSFVNAEKLKGPLQAADFADTLTTEKLLKNAEPADHIFVTYREIPRPGPAPDILKSASGEVPPNRIIREQQELLISPTNAEKDDYYVFRPKFHQDNDGLMRRVHLFLNPRAKQENEATIKESVGDHRTEEEKQKEIKKIERALEKDRQHMESLYR